MKYILINTYSQKNIGDDLFIKILIDKYKHLNFLVLGKPINLQFLNQHTNVTIVDIYSFNIIDSVLLKLKITDFNRFKRKSWESFLKKYNEDISHYAILGGSMFIESPGYNFDTTTLINNRLGHVKKFVIGSNFGPYKSDKFLDAFKNYFSTYNKILFRDTYSANLFNELSNITSLTDFVFNLNFEKSKTISNTVGISIIDFQNRHSIKNHSDNYYSFIKRIIHKSLTESKSCYLFSFCKSENDEKIISKLKVEYPLVNIVYYDGNIDEFLKIYSSMETIVATRFHALVLALLFNQKVLSIIYSQKTLNLINDMNSSINYVELDNLNTFEINILNNLNVVNIDHTLNKAKKYFEILDKELS